MDNKGDFSSNVKGFIEETSPQINSSFEYPSFKLTRGENTLVETTQFTPKSLMTIFIQGTGTSRLTTITMKDHLGQIRYKSSNSGSMHEYITRLQNTRSYGLWKITIEGLLTDEITPFEIEIPFFLVKNIDTSLDEPLYKPEIIEVETDQPIDEETFEIEGMGMTDLEVSGAYNDFEPLDNTNLLDEVLRDEIISADKTPELKIVRQRNFQKDAKITAENIVNDPSNFDEIEIAETEKENGMVEMNITNETYSSEEPILHEDHIVQRNDTEFTTSDESTNIHPKSSILSQDSIIDMNKEGHEEIEILEKAITNFDDEQHLEQIMNEFDSQDLERIKELFIPLDEINMIEPSILNNLNGAKIYYIEEFLLENVKNLHQYTKYSINQILSIKAMIKAIIRDKGNQILSKYKEYGEIKDNTLLYSTIKVSEIKGIGDNTYQKLEKSGLGNITDMANTHVKILSKISGFSCKKAVEFIVEAKSLAYTRVSLIDYNFEEDYPRDVYSNINERSQLDAIGSIKPEDLNKLYGLGINNLGKLIKENPVKLNKAINVKLTTIISWMFEAQVMMNNRVSIQFRYFGT